MGWLFWTLLIIGAVLVFVPFFTTVGVSLALFLWVLGGLLILGAFIWAATFWGAARPTGVGYTTVPATGPMEYGTPSGPSAPGTIIPPGYNEGYGSRDEEMGRGPEERRGEDDGAAPA